MVNMDFETNYAPYEGGAGNLDNTIACTNAVNTASYNFNLTPGGYIAGNPAVVEGGADPLELINNEGGTYDPPLDNINSDGQCGGGKRRRRGRKSKRSKKLRRSNKSRLSTRSRKSKSKVRSKVKKVARKTQNKSFRKSIKKKSRKSLK